MLKIHLNNFYLLRIFVDWSEGSQTINYVAAANRVEIVGGFVASQLNFMRENGFVNFNDVHVIGFSLGAHCAGFVGKNTGGQLHTIIGLDPAGKFLFKKSFFRLNNFLNTKIRSTFQ